MIHSLIQFLLPADQRLVMQVKRQKFNTVSVYGMGDVGVAVVSRLAQTGIELAHWYDSKVTEEGNHLLGITLTPYTRLKEDDAPALIIASEFFTGQIQQVIEANQYPGQIIKV